MHVDPLERRVHLSATFDTASRTMVVTASKRADAVLVFMRRGKVRVTINGALDAAFRLKGVSVIDIRTGRRNDSVTIAAGVPLRVSVSGERGNDTLAGGARDDTLSGDAGDDLVRGSAGNDQVHGGAGRDTLYGGDSSGTVFPSDDDRLYGEGDPDLLVGGAGRDGLFGGLGARDTLTGGPGDDRFLLPEGPNEDRTEDATDWTKAEGDGRVWFRGLFIAGVMDDWTDQEVAAVDTGLEVLHLRVSNTRLLRYSPTELPSVGDRDLLFGRDRHFTHSAGGNGGPLGWISIHNSAFGSDWIIKFIVLHEIGHNWGGELSNPTVADFRALSEWTPRKPFDAPTPPAMLLSEDGSWFYRETASFMTPYSRTSPQEDFAEHFAYSLIVERPQGDLGEKWDYMTAFLDGLAANPLPEG